MKELHQSNKITTLYVNSVTENMRYFVKNEVKHAILLATGQMSLCREMPRIGGYQGLFILILKQLDWLFYVSSGIFAPHFSICKDFYLSDTCANGYLDVIDAETSELANSSSHDFSHSSTTDFR